jgi:dTDP-4-amino-4,6-dideoxygalactose transaminase
LSERREELIKDLVSKEIEVGTHYRPIHTMSAYSNKLAEANTPLTDEVGKRIVTLPIHPNLTDDDVSYIIKAINSFR